MIFSVLAGRYFRPAVVFVYYVNYQLSGLSPWTYHVSVVLIHVVNAWLVFLLGRSMAPGRSVLVPALAGGVFLVFGGHAEAVTWIGGMADPLVTLFLLVAFLLFLRSLDSVRPVPLLIGSWLAFAAALLSKESAAAFLGLALVGAVLARPTWPDRQRVRRTILALSVLVLVLVAYFALRRAVLGFTFVNLEGLGTNTNLLDTARAFVLRSFLPQGSLLSLIWARLPRRLPHRSRGLRARLGRAPRRLPAVAAAGALVRAGCRAGAAVEHLDRHSGDRTADLSAQRLRLPAHRMAHRRRVEAPLARCLGDGALLALALEGARPYQPDVGDGSRDHPQSNDQLRPAHARARPAGATGVRHERRRQRPRRLHLAPGIPRGLAIDLTRSGCGNGGNARVVRVPGVGRERTGPGPPKETRTPSSFVWRAARSLAARRRPHSMH